MPHVKLELDSLRRTNLEQFKDRATLILKEGGAERYLPITISSIEADLLSKELCSVFSIELMSNPKLSLPIINAAPSDLICVTIHFDDGTYYAKVLFYVEDEPREEKCPLRVGLALAYRMEKPIFVNRKVMDEQGLQLHPEWIWGAADSVIKAAEAN